MSVKIGLDFGTHFTKICVEDSKDKRNRSYSFHKFIDLEGNPSLVFPSVVQLNKDNTLSYGFVDTDNAAMVDELLDKDMPKKPVEPKYRSYKQIPEPNKPVAPSTGNSKKRNIISDFSELKQALMEKQSHFRPPRIKKRSRKNDCKFQNGWYCLVMCTNLLRHRLYSIKQRTI